MPIKATAIATTITTLPPRSLWPKLVVVVVMVRSHKQRARQSKRERESESAREWVRRRAASRIAAEFRVQIVVQLSQSTYFLRSATISASFAATCGRLASVQAGRVRVGGGARGRGHHRS